MRRRSPKRYAVRSPRCTTRMLAAVFDIPAGTDTSLSTRIKMGQTSNVYALVKADGKYHVASKEIKVTLGGCGG